MGDKISFSERIFFNFADKHEETFRSLKEDLAKANMQILYQNYVSMAIFYTFVSFFISLALSIFFYFFSKNLLSFLILFFPFIVSVLFFVGPSSKAKSNSEKINEELPFAVIYMAAISQSNIEPIRMFRLIANSKEYPILSFEIKKILNQIDFFGYTLVNSLRDAALKTNNEKLRELFSGIAINIVGGGSLKNFLEKKAENLLIEYRLERQKYNNLAATFLDVYISVLIVAPLILITVLVIMSISGFKINVSLNTLIFIFVAVLFILNLLFLLLLEIKQPKT